MLDLQRWANKRFQLLAAGKYHGSLNPYAGAMGALGTDIGENAVSAFSTDYMGDAFGALSGRAQEIAAARAEVEEPDGAAKAASNTAKTLGSTLSDAARAAKAEWDFYRGTFNGFFSDLSQGLKEGESFWQSFGNAAANALNSIAERLECPRNSTMAASADTRTNTTNWLSGSATSKVLNSPRAKQIPKINNGCIWR
jgi:hypothetical protein